MNILEYIRYMRIFIEEKLDNCLFIICNNFEIMQYFNIY